MKPLLVIALLLLSGCATTPSPQTDPRDPAVYRQQNPVIYPPVR